MQSIYTGLIFIAIAILIRFFPNLLAGYNNLSQRERENAIANGLPKFASIVFVIMGLIVIAGYFLAIWLGKPSLSNGISILTTLIGVVFIIVFGNWFTKERVR
ncbi:MAG: DUF3784 domain-containing protein [Mongoliibacter sp.]|uniref:DUF3784 domain-containing protein n=1 Tax=Mongoliibacter sp. TaxID=2022438 RepID=UPI0012EFC73D|nr:DUF3784 domain-containing protein [Mongoliibacter sp.]TVP46242.1 MAG: DUF3784 domain-containing protein [Mongoliibacter sp.]